MAGAILMNQDQANLVGMFEAVDAYLGEQTPVWLGFKAMEDARAELTDGIAAIRVKAGRQAAPTTGAAVEKEDLRDALEDKTFEVADLTAAWAAAENKPEVTAVVQITRSALDTLSGDDLETTAQHVAAAAQANLAALTDYGVTAADLTDLEAKTAAFSAAKPSPRVAISGRAAETATLPEAIQAVRLLLRNRIDKLMTKFRHTHPEFVAGYRAARVIVDRPGGGGAEKPPDTPPA